MNKNYLDSYKAAGVDIDAGYRALELMREPASRTLNGRVLDPFGSINGVYDMTGLGSQPVMVTSTNSVGTKLKIAFHLDKHDTVGIDCVAMCANDLLCCGAKPLVFVDYLAMGAIQPEKAGVIVSGVAAGCLASGCALVDGKTAQMPGFYAGDQYDLVGVAVGVVEKSRRLDGSTVARGDVILGLGSSGIHANGCSLARKVFDIEEKGLDGYSTVLGRTLGEELLEPSRIYVKPILALLDAVPVKSISHITKGGLHEHLARSFPAGLTARVEVSAIRIPPIFQLIQRVGNVPRADMFGIFNMGVGMSVVVAPQYADEALRILRTAGERVSVIGEVVEGEELQLV